MHRHFDFYSMLGSKLWVNASTLQLLFNAGRLILTASALMIATYYITIQIRSRTNPISFRIDELQRNLKMYLTIHVFSIK